MDNQNKSPSLTNSLWDNKIIFLLFILKLGGFKAALAV